MLGLRRRFSSRIFITLVVRIQPSKLYSLAALDVFVGWALALELAYSRTPRVRNLWKRAKRARPEPLQPSEPFELVLVVDNHIRMFVNTYKLDNSMTTKAHS